MLLLPPSPPAGWLLRAVSASRRRPHARELSAGGHVDCPVGDEAPKGRGLAGPGRSLVSTALTLTPYRRCTPERNRSIPTISAGCLGGRLGNVSAVDTGRGGVSPGFLRHGPAPPSQVRPHCPLPAVCAGSRWSWLDAGSALSLASGRPAPRGAVSTGQGLCVLHEGPTYPKCTRPSSSGAPLSCSASRRRRKPPQ